MSFITFFQNPIKLRNIVSRVKAVYAGNTEILQTLDNMLLEIYKQGRDTEKLKLINNMANQFDVSLWVKNIDGSLMFLNLECDDLFLNSTDGRVISEERSIRFIEHVKYKEKYIWLDVFKEPLIMPDGRINGIIGSAVDISDIIPEEIRKNSTLPQSIEIDIEAVLSASVIIDIFATSKL